MRLWQTQLLIVLIYVVFSGCVYALDTFSLQVDDHESFDFERPSKQLHVQDCAPTSPSQCDYSCDLQDLVVTWLNTSWYDAACQESVITWTFSGSSDAVIRLHLLATSRLSANESLTLLEDTSELAVLTYSGEAWVASGGANLTVQYQRADANATRGHLEMTLTAYNQTQVNETLHDITGTLDAPEQTNATGHADYALNTERLWMLDINAYHINFTIQHVNLDPATDDLLIIGYGSGPWQHLSAGTLLTGKFATGKYHISGGLAYVYFLSRNHDQPRSPFRISYVAEEIVGTTSTQPSTTDKNHPTTPSGAFDLAIYITGTDPKLFVNESSDAVDKLKTTLATYADLYRHSHNIPVWRPVHPDDILFNTWLLCNYASGWVHPDPNCFRVTWYVEMLTTQGYWAFFDDDLRGVIEEYNDAINRDLGYTVSLELDEANSAWWWGFAFAIMPLGLLMFTVLLIIRLKAAKARQAEESVGDVDDECLADRIITGKDMGLAFNEIPEEVPEDDDKQLHSVFNDDDYQDYDPELRGRHRQQQLYARFSSQMPPGAPLKSALKSPKAAPTTYTNAAFESTEDSPLTDQATPPQSANLAKQLDLLDELQEMVKKEKEVPGMELPRITELVDKPQVLEKGVSRMYSVNDDGTGKVVDSPLPGDNILQLEGGADKDQVLQLEHTLSNGVPAKDDSSV